MARDRHPPSIAPPEESESEQEEEEEVEEERVNADAGSRKGAAVEAGEESEEEEESSEKTTSQVRGLDYGSDGDSGKTFPSPSASAFVVKLIAKPETNLKKRPAESELAKEKSEVKKAKKVKKGNGDVAVAAEEVGRRSSGSQRVWYPEDELVILTGMQEYKERTGLDHNSNLDAFHKYIKGSLNNSNVDKSQLISKIKKLKGKYRLNAQKEANGEAPAFLKDLDKEVYEHSKKVWGGQVISLGSQAAKSKPKSKKDIKVNSKAPILEIDNVLALPVPEGEGTKKEVVGGSTKAAGRVHKALKKMDSGEAAVEMKDYDIPMPPVADNFVAEKGSELVEKPKVDEVVGGSTKAASRVRKAVKKMDSGDAAVEMKDYAMPLMADKLMAEKGIVLVEKSKGDEVVGGSTKAASRVRKAVKKMGSGEAAVEMKDYAIPTPPMDDNLMVEKGIELVEKSKVDALNEKWTKYQMDAAQLYVRRLDLVIEHTKIILDALKSKP